MADWDNENGAAAIPTNTRSTHRHIGTKCGHTVEKEGFPRCAPCTRRHFKTSYKQSQEAYHLLSSIIERDMARVERAASAELARHGLGPRGAHVPPWLSQGERRERGQCQCERCSRIANRVRELGQTREAALTVLRDALGRLFKYQSWWWEQQFDRNWQQDEILDDQGQDAWPI